MKPPQQYCVAAEERGSGKRTALTGAMSKSDANGKKLNLNASVAMKKAYRYFHVAKFPYTSKK